MSRTIGVRRWLVVHLAPLAVLTSCVSPRLGGDADADSSDRESSRWVLLSIPRVAGVPRGDWRRCELVLERVARQISGFVAQPPAEGTEGERISGEFIPGAVPLVILRRADVKREIVYQLRWTKLGTYEGVWDDTKGNHGDAIISMIVPREVARWIPMR